jgi:hypothetical protein
VLFVVLSRFGQFLGLRLGIHVAVRARFLGGFNVLRLAEGQRRAHQKTSQQDGGGNGVFDLQHETSVPPFCNWIATYRTCDLLLHAAFSASLQAASPGELPPLSSSLWAN